MVFTDKEAEVLDRVQHDFPEGTRPYESMARELSMDEKDLLRIIQNLKERGVIRSISGIFNAVRLGYTSALVAFKIESSSVESAAHFVNAHPGVSHNYLRDHDFNLWFTIAANDQKLLDASVSVLAGRAGALDYLILPVKKLFKIGVHFPIRSHGSVVFPPIHDTSKGETVAGEPAHFAGDALEALRILQADCPVDSEPFTRLVKRERSFLEGEKVVRFLSDFRKNGILRRYSAVLLHRKAGFNANAMTAWKPDTNRTVDEIAASFRASRAVSHLYLRRASRGSWDHPLFAMVHARNDEELSETILNLSRGSGLDDYLILKTIRELKKERVTYLSRAFEEWGKEAGL